jgi:hypothetical protein
MTLFMLMHQAVLCAHLAAFAFAFSAVVREDLAFFAHGRIDLQRLAATARTVTLCLAALWASGLLLIAFDVYRTQALVVSPKLAAKLLVVCALTANGIALHAVAFPRMRLCAGQTIDALTLPVLLGAVSTASWICASFIGVARLVGPAMSFGDFLAVYAVMLGGAMVCALLFVRLRVARLLQGVHG